MSRTGDQTKSASRACRWDGRELPLTLDPVELAVDIAPEV
jgi:hypothetical protein